MMGKYFLYVSVIQHLDYMWVVSVIDVIYHDVDTKSIPIEEKLMVEVLLQ